MRHLILSTLLFAFMISCSRDCFSSPQECRNVLIVVGELFGYHKPLWKLSDTEIGEFKNKAKEKGYWSLFAQVCNAWPAEKCKSCKCGRDFRDDACSPNCACCWGDVSCSLNL